MGQAVVDSAPKRRTDPVSWLLAHHLLSATAQAMVLVVVAQVVFDATDSPGWVAAAGAARLLPYLCCSGFAGTIADRSDRRRMLAHSAWWRAASIAILAGATAVGAPPVVLIAALAVTTTLGTVCYPAVAAAVPMVAGPRLHRASSQLNLIETSAWLVGPAVGGAMVAIADPSFALAVNAGILVAAARCLASVPALPSGEVQARSALRRMAEGVGIVCHDRTVLAALAPVLFVNVLLGMSTVFLPVVADDLVGLGDGGYGVLAAALGVGGLFGALGASRLPQRHTARATTATAVVAIVAFGGLALVRSTTFAIALVAIAGAGAVASEVLAMVRLMTIVHHRLLARVVGVVDSLLVTALLAGTGVAPVLLGSFSMPVSLLVSTGLLSGGALVSCVLRQETRKPTATTVVANEALTTPAYRAA